MAKNYGKLAKRYARALLGATEIEFGCEGSPTPAQKVAGSLARFAEMWKKTPELPLSLLSPMFDSAERLQALLEIARKAGLSDIEQRFLRILFERGRLVAIAEIVEQLNELADAGAGVVQVEVCVARDVDAREQKGIEQVVGSNIEGVPVFVWRIDPELLGGMIVRYHGKVIDGSLNGQLERMERGLRA